MTTEPRTAVADHGLVADASAHLASEVAMHLPFEALGPFKTALKRFFSAGPWTDQDARDLSDLVTPHLSQGWWEHDLGHGLTLAHGIADGAYRIEVRGETAERAPSVFDRAFSGPVVPRQTPHPLKVRFDVGGTPAPGVWHRRGEEIDDDRVAALMEDPDVTDVMVAGDFVTVGLARSASWEERLEGILGRVTDLFWTGAEQAAAERTREQLLEEAGRLSVAEIRPEDLHLMDPERPEHRALLIAALDADDARSRRAAVVTLAMSGDPAMAKTAIVTGYADRALIVRRAAVDAAADLEDEEYRPLFDEAAVHDPDPWTRWKAITAIADIGAGESIDALALAAVDEEFRVRFEAEQVLRQANGE